VLTRFDTAPPDPDAIDVKKIVLFTFTHVAALAAGFALGIYLLPILTAPESPSSAQLDTVADMARFTGEFRRNLAGSDALHWGEGQVFVSDQAVSLKGRISPGPDYRLYLAPEFVDTETEFLALKSHALEVGSVNTFENFIVPLPASVDVSRFNSVVVWCESFSEFITAAEYRPVR